MITVADFKTRFPEFTSVAEPRVQLFIDDAVLLMATPDRWLTFYDVALSYHAAHLLYVGGLSESSDGGVVAPVKKQVVDDVALEQAVTALSPKASDLFSTSYGKRYYSYLRMVFAGPYGV